MASLFNGAPSVSTIFSLYTTVSALTMVLRTILKEIIPKNLKDYIAAKFLDVFLPYMQSNFTFVIEQKWEYVENQTFRAAEVYLPTRLVGPSIGKLLVGSSNLKKPTAPPKLGISVDTKIVDEFQGIRVEWSLHSVQSKKYPHEKRFFHLTCKKEHREKVMEDYFQHLLKSAKKIMNQRENLKIYTYNEDISGWESTIFEHHSTFETLAIEPELKKSIIDDLDAFSRGKDFFKSVGRAWKRGYLLYGPPGTGKSSLVAAIANHMKYNIYDLQIQSVKDDAELRQILTSTKNRSILLIEDIDCSAGASRKRKAKNSDENGEEDDKGKPQKAKKIDIGITLSGLLNFVDGLWSSCGEERIIIFTTNHKEKLDPALLRPGRMDFHILMDYCTPFVFRKLAALYLRIKEHSLLEPIEKLIQEVKTTPAEVAQQLMASKNHDTGLQALLEFLEAKRMKEGDGQEEAEEGEEGEIENAEDNEAEA